jgi:hypothetical protein
MVALGDNRSTAVKGRREAVSNSRQRTTFETGRVRRRDAGDSSQTGVPLCTAQKQCRLPAGARY